MNIISCSCKIQDQLPAYPAVVAVVGIYPFFDEKIAFFAKIKSKAPATIFTVFWGLQDNHK